MCSTQQPHFWSIDPPQGRLSRGQCIHCGATGVFPNSVETALQLHYQRKNAAMPDIELIAPQLDIDLDALIPLVPMSWVDIKAAIRA